jgi:DNA-binding IscR family transcriptional regulator
MEIPDKFSTKIARQLARSGFIEIVRGAKGEIRLSPGSSSKLLNKPGECYDT